MSFISYYRVSTHKQGYTGLGMEAQKAAVRAYVRGECVASYTEVESGKRDDRPELMKAIEHAKSVGAKLVIAKLDRLSRDPDFIGALMKASVDFIACDMPDANKLTIRIMAAIAEHERELISVRTKQALAIKRDQLAAEGKRLGNPSPHRTLALGREKRVAKANAGKAQVMLSINDIRTGGITTLKGIAEALNAHGVKTARGGAWSATQVSRVLA